MLATLLTTWGGFVLGVIAVGAVLWHQGVLAEAWAAIYTFNKGLLSVGDFLASAKTRVAARNELTPLSLPLWLALVGLVISIGHRRFQGFPLRLAIGLVVWWAISAVLAGMGPSKSMRYWQGTFPPVLILAAVGMSYIDIAYVRLARPHRGTLAVLAVSIILFLAAPAAREIRHGFFYSLAAFREPSTEREKLIEIGNRVRELTGPQDRIYVFDYATGIYVYADRLPAVRFTYPRSEEQLNQILSELEAGDAKLLLLPERTAPEFRGFCGAECGERLKKLGEKCEPKGPAGQPPYFVCAFDSEPESE